LAIFDDNPDWKFAKNVHSTSHRKDVKKKRKRKRKRRKEKRRDKKSRVDRRPTKLARDAK